MNMLCVPVGPLEANCYLVWDDERRACAIDPGGEPERLARIVEEQRLILEAIFVTHGHFDHVDGVKGLAGATNATVYCSAGVVPVLTGTEGCPATGYPIPALTEQKVVAVSEDKPVRVGTLSVVAISTPGHTPADVTYDIDGHLFCGDLVFYRSVGRTDFSGGDFDSLLASVGMLAKRYPATTPIHPGHMQSTTLGEELRLNPFLAELSIHG
jgi:hydroxyacylglutathione hydrolase